MPKRLFRKYLPSPDRLKGHKSLSFLGGVLSDPNLWHINRHSLAGAAFIGVFTGLLPIPLQMGLAALLAVRFHCNLPLSVVLVWISVVPHSTVIILVHFKFCTYKRFQTPHPPSSRRFDPKGD